ncbi:hypothetical protein SDC9_130458 [bioreactor metagenome]|uniref:Uncharacterized protein n=1 Tax=bioreactor metagenome TaxID=1076179 RepID=A0A645D287_9ZZZZ
MLHLEPGVHLQKRNRAVGGQQKLDSSRSDIAGGRADVTSRAGDQRMLVRSEEGSGCFLHEFLAAALKATVAGPDRDNRAGRVAENLDLHMARAVEIALHVAFAGSEGLGGFADRGFVLLNDIFGAPYHPQTPATAAVGCLDRYRKAVSGRESCGLVRTGDGPRSARHERRSDLLGKSPGGDLVTKQVNDFGRRTDPDQSGVEHCASKVRVLGEEPVARVHGVGSRTASYPDQLGDIKIGLGCSGALKGPSLVGQPHELGISVGVGVDRDRDAAGVVAGTHDANGDLTTIGDQDPVHGSSKEVGVWTASGVNELSAAVKRTEMPGVSWAATASARVVSTAITGYPPVTG